MLQKDIYFKAFYTCVIFDQQQQNQNQTPRTSDLPKNNLKNQVWSGVFHITLVEGQDLPQYGQGDVYVRFRLGDQKYKSKVCLLFFFKLFFSFHHPPPFSFTSLAFLFSILPSSSSSAGAHQ